MKITVDFLRAEQHWDPSSGASQNYLVFAFAGREHRLPCTEDDIKNAVLSSVGAPTPPAVRLEEQAPQYPTPSSFSAVDGETDGGELDQAFEDGSFDEERVAELEAMESAQGVAPVPTPPLAFHKTEAKPAAPAPTQNAMEIRQDMIAQGLATRPRTTASIKAANQERARAVASRAPHVRAVAADEQGNPIVPEHHRVQGPPTGPAPTVRRAAPRTTTDDDPFEQG